MSAIVTPGRGPGARAKGPGGRGPGARGPGARGPGAGVSGGLVVAHGVGGARRFQVPAPRLMGALPRWRSRSRSPPRGYRSRAPSPVRLPALDRALQRIAPGGPAATRARYGCPPKRSRQRTRPVPDPTGAPVRPVRAAPLPAPRPPQWFVEQVRKLRPSDYELQTRALAWAIEKIWVEYYRK